MSQYTSQKLIFVSTFDYPTRFAHALHGLHMARAFAAQSGDSFLYIVNTAVSPDELAGIGYRRLFGRFGRRIKKLHLRRVLIPVSLAWFFITNPTWRKVIVLTTDPALFPTLAFLKKIFGFTFVCECHGVLTPMQDASIAQHADAIFFVTASLKNNFVTMHPERTNKAYLLPNAVDVEAFAAVSDDKIQLRKKLSLPLENTLVGYVGRFEPLGDDKGLHLMIDSVQNLPADIMLVLVGGAKAEIARYADYVASKGLQDRVVLVPYVTLGLVAEYEKACDMLAYVPAARTRFFEKETSPMKLFEYMATHRPIIVSDSGAMREILDDSSALFVEAGSQQQFVDAIQNLAEHPDIGMRLADAALKKVSHNTWKQRAQEIMKSVNRQSVR